MSANITQPLKFLFFSTGTLPAVSLNQGTGIKQEHTQQHHRQQQPYIAASQAQDDQPLIWSCVQAKRESAGAPRGHQNGGGGIGVKEQDNGGEGGLHSSSQHVEHEGSAPRLPAKS